MSIPQKKYVAITSAIAKTAQAAHKELITRVYTKNPLFAANTVYEFAQAPDVSDFAGALSAEALFASEYFGWVSKKADSAQKISFMRYSFTALAPYMYTIKALPSLNTLKAVTAGSMVVNLGGTAYTVSGLDFSSITSFADAASVIQTGLRGNTAGGAMWTAAEFTYNASPAGFTLTGGEAGAAEINYCAAAETGTDISSMLGLDAASMPVLSNGTAAASITDILNQSIDISTNFASFGFLDAADAFSNLDAIGAWNTAQNNEYLFCFDLSSSNYAAGIETAKKYTGMSANYNVNYGISGINPAWLMPAVLGASSNYDRANGAKNYMFQQFPEQAVSVGNNDGTLYQTLDNLNINYNGQTQKAGQKIAFYQNGFNADGTDTAVYVNEIWLKDVIATDILNAFLGLDFVSADADGKAVIAGIIDNTAEKAFNNHVFAKGKILTQAEKAYIAQVFGSENAWLDVQNNSYKYVIDITSQTSQGGAVIYIGNYTLVYCKNDALRKVTGSNILV